MSEGLGESSFMDVSNSTYSHSETAFTQTSSFETSQQQTTVEDDLDDLPSEPDSDEDTISEEEGETDADREWRESIQQLELLLSMVLVPWAGKMFGRKAAYWGWARFMQWKYPVEIVITNPALHNTAGAVEAAASL